MRYRDILHYASAHVHTAMFIRFYKYVFLCLCVYVLVLLVVAELSGRGRFWASWSLRRRGQGFTQKLQHLRFPDPSAKTDQEILKTYQNYEESPKKMGNEESPKTYQEIINHEKLENE